MIKNCIASRSIGICINKSACYRIIIPALEIVQPHLYVTVVALTGNLAALRMVSGCENDLIIRIQFAGGDSTDAEIAGEVQGIGFVDT